MAVPQWIVLPSAPAGDVADTASTNTFTVTQDFNAGIYLDSLRVGYDAKTTTYPITANDFVIDCTSGTFTVTLPTAVGTSGKAAMFIIKNSGTGVITLATTSGQTIDGSASGAITLNQYDSLTVVSNNVDWIII